MMWPYQFERLSFYAKPFTRFSDDECSVRLSKGLSLTPDEKKRAIAFNNKQRKRKKK